MKFLHTMLRVKNLDESLNFFCEKLGMKIVSRRDYEQGRFTLVFLSADEDFERASSESAPCLELTFNWPDEKGEVENYTGGRNFGHVAFRVKNIYATCQRLMDLGVEINRPPRDGYMAFLKSPDGISIELLQENDPLDVCEPWQSMANRGSW